MSCHDCACVSASGAGWVAFLGGGDASGDPEQRPVVYVCPPCIARRGGFDLRAPYT